MREKINLGIKPIKLNMGYSGNHGPDKKTPQYYFQKLISQNIVYAAYHEPKTVTEIAETNTPFHTLQKNEQVNLVEQLIERLSERKRMIVQLRDIEGESYKAIAQALNVSESQVKTDLFRARQELKQHYNNIN
jgi:RNA polymerase sigma-70 factor (ECF subfamily)